MESVRGQRQNAEDSVTGFREKRDWPEKGGGSGY